MLKFDYVETEKLTGVWAIYVGLAFEDEPDELYVAHFQMTENGEVSEPQLLFNGMDCRYKWKPDERALLMSFVREQVGGKLPF